ncbi:precorrin-2 dehydrogenase/sirohydrochlorin ferrochelatase family protein, partial [Cellulomonas massiliensis]|uniref:precorrin-2 dehydrogenase/sirohydrochlorin ferrochelatase family protein n=1 Tax=Cellulomonas massiliensis TaxID=1465811 RepID=UPI000474D66A
MSTLLALDLLGHRVLVVGGGPVAARRAAALVADGAEVVVVAPDACEPMRELVERGDARWERRDVREDDLDGVWLVHTATGDRAADAAVGRWAAERRVFCVDAADAGRGTARTPATTTVGDVTVGVVSTGAPDPARSAAVRDALAATLRE